MTLRLSVGMLVRRIRQFRTEGEIFGSHLHTLALLDREGPSSSSELAKREQITPQSMGVTLAALEAQGYVERSADPTDGRRVVMSLTRAGRDIVLRARDASTDAMARALVAHFTDDERQRLRVAAPLLERLAHALETHPR